MLDCRLAHFIHEQLHTYEWFSALLCQHVPRLNGHYYLWLNSIIKNIVGLVIINPNLHKPSAEPADRTPSPDWDRERIRRIGVAKSSSSSKSRESRRTNDFGKGYILNEFTMEQRTHMTNNELSVEHTKLFKLFVRDWLQTCFHSVLHNLK